MEGELHEDLIRVRDNLLEVGQNYFDLIPAATHREKELEREYFQQISNYRQHINIISDSISKISDELIYYRHQKDIYQILHDHVLTLSDLVNIMKRPFNRPILQDLVADVATVSLKLEALEVDDLKNSYSERSSLFLSEVITVINSREYDLLKIAETGFFGMEIDFVNAYLNSDTGIRWGGKYNSLKDWMHFEMHPLSDYLLE